MTTKRGKRQRVLFAEDDAHVAAVMKLALERCGHRVEHVEDGKDAIERITAGREAFDLLLTDHEMPTVSGLRLVEQVRGTSFAGRIIVHSSELHMRDAA